MESTGFISRGFPRASLTLKEFLTQTQGYMAELKLSSGETLQRMRQKVLDSWSRWPEIVDSYRASIHEMPKALRKMDFIKKSIADIDAVEIEFKKFVGEVREISLQDIKDNLDSLQFKFKEMTENLDELQEHSLIQKFLHGERVLSARENLQWRRKFFHCCSGVFFLYLYVYAGLSSSTIALVGWSFAAACVLTETVRHLIPAFNDWCCWFFGPLMRECEKDRINSAVFYVVSMWSVYLVFPVEVSMLTVLFIAVGDPVAGIVGVKWGRTKIKPHVSLEGFIACAATCALMSFIFAGFLFENTLSFFPLVVFSLLGGLTGAFAESSFKKIDDNLVMPLMSAPILWVLLMVFGVI